MENYFRISKSEITFEVDRENGYRSMGTVELQNPDYNKRKGFKIKSNNIQRYVVNPSSGLIDPLKTIKITIMMNFSPTDNLKNVRDKFRIYFIEIDEEHISKQNIDQFIAKNEHNIKKATLGVKIVEKQGKQPLRTTKTPANLLSGQTSLRESNVSSYKESHLFESIINHDIPIPSTKEDKIEVEQGKEKMELESSLIEKENEILRLKEANHILEKDIALIRGKIVLNEDDKMNVRKEKAQIWQLLYVFLIGLMIGAYLNSAKKVAALSS